jgi:hypothetical protein
MATAKKVKQLQTWGEEDEVIKKLMEREMVQPRVFITDYYYPSTANWSWQIGIAKIDDKYYELLTQFGSIKGGREIYFHEYKLDELIKNEN